MSQPPAKARILYLDHTSHLGGAERSLLDLLERLDRDRLEPILATSGGGPLVDRARALGVEVVVMSVGDKALELSREAWQDQPWRVLWQARGFAREIARLVRLVRTRRIEAIHTNTLKAHVLGSIVAWLARRPIVWHMRDLPSSRGDARRLLARFFRLVRPGILAISEAVAADMPPGMRERTRVVYNGIDLPRFDARAAEPPAGPVGPPGEGPLVGTVSHLIPWKGQEIFLRAIARLAPDHPDWRFVVVGDPIFQFRGERDRLEALAAELGILGRVQFAGHREDVPALLSRLDMFVLPSLYEPFGRVLIEAMAARLPIVASRAGGVPEIVVDGESGVLVTPGDDQALAVAIAALLGDPARASAMAGAARARVEARFSLDATVRGVLEAYEAFGLLSNRPTSY